MKYCAAAEGMRRSQSNREAGEAKGDVGTSGLNNANSDLEIGIFLHIFTGFSKNEWHIPDKSPILLRRKGLAWLDGLSFV